MKKWRCLACGYIHKGEISPKVCLVCNATKNQFVLVEEDKKKYNDEED